MRDLGGSKKNAESLKWVQRMQSPQVGPKNAEPLKWIQIRQCLSGGSKECRASQVGPKRVSCHVAKRYGQMRVFFQNILQGQKRNHWQKIIDVVEWQLWLKSNAIKQLGWGKSSIQVAFSTTKNIGKQSVQELFFCDRSICKTVCRNDLVKCTVWSTYDVTLVMVR